jgi:hypothetical protein
MIKARLGAFRDWGAVRRVGVAGGVLIVTAALALAGCGGGGGTATSTPHGPATSTLPATTTSNPHGTATSTPHGTATSTLPATTTTNPHGTATSTLPATTTTRLNTIKPIPGRSAPPFYDYNSSTIYSASPVTGQNGVQYGVCRGTPPTTEVILSWTTFYTDYVQLGGDRGKNYPANDYDFFDRIPCDADHGPLSSPRARITFTLFGPGGETTAEANIFVENNYQPY